MATPFVIGRHSHRAVPQAARPPAEPTGIDYLGMVAAAHEAEMVGPISFAQAPLFDNDNDNDNDADGTIR